MHNITERDAQVGLSQAWHGLTDVVETIDVKDNVLTKWDVERKPLTYVDVDGNEQETGYGILVGSDDDKIIGRPMTPSYKAISNEKFLDLVSDAMAKLPKAKIESKLLKLNREIHKHLLCEPCRSQNLEKARRKTIELGLINSRIWDQYLSKNMNWRFNHFTSKELQPLIFVFSIEGP